MAIAYAKVAIALSIAKGCPCLTFSCKLDRAGTGNLFRLYQSAARAPPGLPLCLRQWSQRPVKLEACCHTACLLLLRPRATNFSASADTTSQPGASVQHLCRARPSAPRALPGPPPRLRRRTPPARPRGCPGGSPPAAWAAAAGAPAAAAAHELARARSRPVEGLRMAYCQVVRCFTWQQRSYCKSGVRLFCSHGGLRV